MPKFFSDQGKRCNSQYTIQTPSKVDRMMMQSMVAGSSEDQCERLGNMVKTIAQVQMSQHVSSIITTGQRRLSNSWNQLFRAIRDGNKDLAFELFDKIPQNDFILKPLLLVHPAEYLKTVIKSSIDALDYELSVVDSDIIFTPGTFEILIKDIATSIGCPTKICFSFGLPTHHAYNQMASGFCILNKTAVLIRHAELTHSEPLKYIIVGSDVNRDNGLCQVLMDSASHLDVCHIDIFDSRVYPKDKQNDINDQLVLEGIDDLHKITLWQKNQLRYYAVDLKLTTREENTVHPALTFTLAKVQETIEQAQKNHQKAIIFLPTGWDSHEDETAPCGHYINGRPMSSATAHQYRFSDSDMEFFYTQLFNLYNDHAQSLDGMYWGLEGGYNRAMYESQIKLFLDCANTQLNQHNSDPIPPRSTHVACPPFT